MKRDWEVIREVLTEIEALDGSKHQPITYGPESEDASKAAHGFLLWEAGFIRGVDATTYDGKAVVAEDLTWAGHDLLETIRSKVVWERIKTTAKEKGIELSFDAVKALGKAALAAIIGS